MIDLFGVIIFQAGVFQYVALDIPYITEFFAPFSTTLLLSLGSVILVASMFLYLVPMIKANSSDANKKDPAVQRSKR